MKPPFNFVPAFPVAIGWIAGILLWWLGAGWWCPALMTVLGIALLFIKTQYVAMGCYAVAASWTLAFINTPTQAPEGIFDGDERTYNAEIIRAKNTPRIQSLLLRVDSIDNVAVRPFVIKSASLPEWISPRIGSTVILTTILEPLDEGGDFPFQTDYSLDNLRNAVVAQTYIEGDSLKVTGRHTSLNSWLSDRRMDIVSLLAHSGIDDKTYGLLSALITGYGDDLDNDMREDFRATGIAHALALSGFHVGIIIMICSFILFPLCAWPKLRPWRYAVSLLILWFYAGMVGLSESVVRASVMFSVLVICRIAGRRPNGYNALCMAILIMLALRPFSLFSPGFQLSVCAVLGILVFNKALNPVNPKNHKAYNYMQFATLPLSALIGTVPLTIYYFHKLPMLFLASNLLITLLLPILMVSGILIIATSACGMANGLLCNIADGLVTLIDDAISSLSLLPVAQTSVYFNGIQSILLAIALTALGLTLYSEKLKLKAAMMAIIALCSLTIPISRIAIPDEEAFIVRLPGNTPIVLRDGHKAVVRFTCHPRRIESAGMRLKRELEHYSSAVAIDTMIITTGNASVGRFAIKDNY